MANKKDNISEQVREGFEKKTGIKLLNVLYDTDMDKYDKYLEQLPSKILDVIDKMPVKEVISHFGDRNYIDKKELKAEIEKVIRGEV